MSSGGRRWAGQEAGRLAWGVADVGAVLNAGVANLRVIVFFFSSRRRHTRFDCDWSSDVCSSDLCAGFGDQSGIVAGVGEGRGFGGERGEGAAGFHIDQSVAFGGGIVHARIGESARSEEHTSELQSQSNLVCRLLLEKKKTAPVTIHICLFFFFNDTATTEIYTLSLHDALPISALDLVINRGLSPVSVKEEASAANAAKVQRVSISTKVSHSAVESFTRELANLLDRKSVV